MPIKVQRDLPAKAILESENIFIMDEDRAMRQDIRPLEILILNRQRNWNSGVSIIRESAWEFLQINRKK